MKARDMPDLIVSILTVALAGLAFAYAGWILATRP